MPTEEQHSKDVQAMKDFMNQQVQGLAAGKGVMPNYFGAVSPEAPPYIKIRGKVLSIPSRGYARPMSIALLCLYALENPMIDAILKVCDLRWEGQDGKLVPLFDDVKHPAGKKGITVDPVENFVDFVDQLKTKPSKGPAKKSLLLGDEEDTLLGKPVSAGQRVLVLPNEHFQEHHLGTIDGGPLPGDEARFFVLVEVTPFTSTKCNLAADLLRPITTPEELANARKLLPGA